MNNPDSLLYCCTRCQYYNGCIKKWLRGEKGEPDYCCNQCNFFYECHPHLKDKPPLQNNSEKKSSQ